MPDSPASLSFATVCACYEALLLAALAACVGGWLLLVGLSSAGRRVLRVRSLGGAGTAGADEHTTDFSVFYTVAELVFHVFP